MSHITCPRIHVIGMRSLYKGMPFQLTEARIFESVLIDMKRFLSRHGLSINQSFAKQEIFWSFSYEPNDEGFWYLIFYNMTGLINACCAKKFRVKMMTEDKHQGKGSWGTGKSPKGGRGGDEKISKGSRGGDELSEGKSRGGDEESFTQSPGETIINPQYLIILGYFSPAVAFCRGCYDNSCFQLNIEYGCLCSKFSDWIVNGECELTKDVAGERYFGSVTRVQGEKGGHCHQRKCRL